MSAETAMAKLGLSDTLTFVSKLHCSLWAGSVCMHCDYSQDTEDSHAAQRTFCLLLDVAVEEHKSKAWAFLD